MLEDEEDTDEEIGAEDAGEEIPPDDALDEDDEEDIEFLLEEEIDPPVTQAAPTRPKCGGRVPTQAVQYAEPLSQTVVTGSVQCHPPA